jgi:hypothetical protein
VTNEVVAADLEVPSSKCKSGSSPRGNRNGSARKRRRRFDLSRNRREERRDALGELAKGPLEERPHRRHLQTLDAIEPTTRKALRVGCAAFQSIAKASMTLSAARGATGYSLLGSSRTDAIGQLEIGREIRVIGETVAVLDDVVEHGDDAARRRRVFWKNRKNRSRPCSSSGIYHDRL